MQITLTFHNIQYEADLSKPLDISLPLRPGNNTVNCFYAPPVVIEPVVAGGFVGSVARGGPVNFVNVHLNPHGNGTHTECVGHIAEEVFTINDCMQSFHHLAKLVTIQPELQQNGDRVIGLKQIQEVFTKYEAPALVIRTLPNDDSKKTRHYSGTNPPYFHSGAIQYLVEGGVRHLLVDLPSVDREDDGGKLLSHRAFWQYPATVEKKPQKLQHYRVNFR